VGDGVGTGGGGGQLLLQEQKDWRQHVQEIENWSMCLLVDSDSAPAKRVCRHSQRSRHACHGKQLRRVALLVCVGCDCACAGARKQRRYACAGGRA
jgi:hypothetical protein